MATEQWYVETPATCWVVLRLRWGGRSAGDWIPERCGQPMPCPDHPQQSDGRDGGN